MGLQSIFDDIRQLRYPAPLRIKQGSWDHSSIAALKKILGELETPSTISGVGPHADTDEVLRVLANVSTGLWRLKQRMLQPGTNRPLEEMSRAYRHLESTWDLLTDAGVGIIDHTNTPFDPGMQVKVLAFEPRAGISRERIIETIKPSVYHRSQLIQMGEVIVVTPELSQG